MSESSVFLVLGVSCLYLGYLVLPGYVTLCLMGVHRNRFLLAYGISFSVLVLTQIPSRVFGGSVMMWYWMVHLTIGILLVAAWIFRRQHKSTVTSKRIGRWTTEGVGFFIVIVAFSLYHLKVGPYTEIPSDFWVHLGNVWSELANINEGLHGYGLNVKEISNGEYVPFLHAIAANLFQSNPLWLVPGATLITSVIFLGATYWFTLRVIAKVRLSKKSKILIAMLTVVLTVLSFGVATFSYVRYYAYFHTIFNFPLIYVSLVLLMDYLERSESSTAKLIPIPVFLLTMSIVHKQEALFALILIAGMVLWRMIRTFQISGGIPESLWRRTRILGLSVATLLPVVLIYTFLKRDMGLPGSLAVIDATQGTWMFQLDVLQKIVVIDLGHLIPFLKGLPIANPGLRFWDTLAPFGIIVYLWYFSRYRWVAKVDYITVGMASPLLTMFNPVFVIWFLHLMTADTLWRMSYLMPLSMVGAFLIVHSFSDSMRRDSRTKLWSPVLMTLILGGALMPFDFKYFYNLDSRLPSLQSIDQTNGAGLWADLIRIVEKIDGHRVILADGVTRYVLSNATPHRQGNSGKELWRDKRQKDDLLVKVVQRNFKQGYILVINRRDGFKSASAEVSGHWPYRILEVSRHYPLELDEILDYEIHRQSQEPDFFGIPLGKFELLWSADNIDVYKVL